MQLCSDSMTHTLVLMAIVVAGCGSTSPCQTNNGGCDSNADCSDTGGVISCACSTGFTGDGMTCQPAAQNLAGVYTGSVTETFACPSPSSFTLTDTYTITQSGPAATITFTSCPQSLFTVYPRRSPS
jgi:hypothetical protein